MVFIEAGGASITPMNGSVIPSMFRIDFPAKQNSKNGQVQGKV